VLAEVEEDVEARRLRRAITVFRRRGAAYRRSDETHVVQVLAREEIEGALDAAGFAVRTARRGGAFAVPQRRVVFFAQKPGAAGLQLRADG